MNFSSFSEEKDEKKESAKMNHVAVHILKYVSRPMYYMVVRLCRQLLVAT